MDDQKHVDAICRKCGKPLDRTEKSDEGEQLYCTQCLIEVAEQHVPEEAELSELRRIRTSKIGVALFWVGLFVCLSIIATQVPNLVSTFEEEQPIRRGSYSTDVKTDQCVSNLWQICKLLQEGKSLGDDIVCPVSKKPYVISTVEGDTMVCCANPELHGFSEIRANKNYPLPELIK